MIQQVKNTREDYNMGAAEVENIEKYRSYIQRRRVGSGDAEAELSAEPFKDRAVEAEDYVMRSEKDYGKDPGFNDHDSFIENERDDPLKKLLEDDTIRTKSYSDTSSVSSAPYRRSDPDIYRRFYGRNRRTSTGYKNAASMYGAGKHTETEDNGATLLAIKIIKQCLVCFAVIGVIVLMQRINAMSGVLAFLKKHVVETNFEPKNIISGAENLIEECTRLLGGSP